MGKGGRRISTDTRHKDPPGAPTTSRAPSLPQGRSGSSHDWPCGSRPRRWLPGWWVLGHLSWEGGLTGSVKGYSILLSSWAVLDIHSFIQSFIHSSHKHLPVGCQGFLGGSNGKESTCQCRRCRRPTFNFWVGKIPWRRKWQPSPVFLPGKSHGQMSLAGTVHGGAKSQMRLRN